ncbi:MAG: hypothetical protein WC827_04225 [Candidatus Paceibacterota bacterium]|jgi:hypothetical protein
MKNKSYGVWSGTALILGLIALAFTHKWLIFLIVYITSIIILNIRFSGTDIIKSKDRTIEWEDHIEKLPDDNNKNEFVRLISDFFIIDNIKPESFYANYQILISGSRKICKSEAKLHDEVDISDLGTKSIDTVASPYDRPIGLPKWFIAGYPDITNWIKNSPNDRLEKIFDNLRGDSFLNVDGKITNENLRKLVDVYKKDNNLECI